MYLFDECCQSCKVPCYSYLGNQVLTSNQIADFDIAIPCPNLKEDQMQFIYEGFLK